MIAMYGAHLHHGGSVIAYKAIMDAPRPVPTLPSGLDIGDDKAVAELVVLLYSELRSLASHYLQRERGEHTLQTTALVHEAYRRNCCAASWLTTAVAMTPRSAAEAWRKFSWKKLPAFPKARRRTSSHWMKL